MSGDFLYKRLRGLCRLLDGISELLGKGTAWLVVLVVLVVFANVVMRYAFNLSFVFLQELEWHLFAAIFLLGAAYTLVKDGHVRVDIFYQRLSRRGQAWVNLAGVLLFLFPGCYLVIATGMPFAVSSFQIGEGSPDPGGIPCRYILKFMIPVSFMLLGLQGLSLAVKSLLVIAGADEGAEGDGEGVD